MGADRLAIEKSTKPRSQFKQPMIGRRGLLGALALMAVLTGVMTARAWRHRSQDQEEFFTARRAVFCLEELGRALECYRQQHNVPPGSLDALFDAGCLHRSTGLEVLASGHMLESPLKADNTWLPLGGMLVRREALNNAGIDEGAVAAVVLPSTVLPDTAFALLSNGSVVWLPKEEYQKEAATWIVRLGGSSIWP